MSKAQDCQGHTLTQGGWGAPNTNNPNVSYLYENFNKAFPNGLTVGCAGGYTLKLTDATSVTAFLPSGSTPRSLDYNYQNPGENYNNVLAGQLVAVMLAVGFDSYDENFSKSNSDLANFIINSGKFKGMTVNQFLVLANNFIGGCGGSQYSASDFNEAASAINENYDEGTRDLGYLSCCKLQIHISFDPIKCYGETTTVHVTASDGSVNTTGIGDFVVGAGTYTYTVTDGDCTSTETIVISQPEKLLINVNYTPIKCNGEKSTVTVSASGGTAPYVGTGTFDVSAGTYTYSITDANGCSDSKTITITEPEKLLINVNYTPITCNGEKSIVTVSASGGTAPYVGTGTFDVSAGTYTYSITDANGCSDSKTITISEPEKLVASCISTDAKCNGEKGSIQVTAIGGTMPYSGIGTFDVVAGTYIYTITDANGCTATTTCTVSQPEKLVISIEFTPIKCNGEKSTVTVSASGGTAPYVGTGTFDVSAGTYTYSITDANGCSDSKTITITQPTPLALTITKGDVMCIGGTAMASVEISGGTEPYTYLWSNGAITKSVELEVGNYSVTVTDANGCSISKSFEIKMLSCGGFTTVTQGGWGAKAAGKNWGKYRDDHFVSAFPNGVTIGAGSRFIKLTTAKAVDDFLPSGTTPRTLDNGTLINPGDKYKNVLAGQVVALTLSLGFDQADANFSAASGWLGDLVVVSGAFSGWSVSQILAEANNILGGLSSNYTASQINDIVDAINNNYDEGKKNNGLLSCPCSSITLAKPIAVAPVAIASTQIDESVILYPNPSKGEINLKFSAEQGSVISIQLFNYSGKMVADLSKSARWLGKTVSIQYNNSNLLDGVYLVKVKTPDIEKVIRLIIKR